jgi:polar amino acid transport system substrate-binding protein
MLRIGVLRFLAISVLAATLTAFHCTKSVAATSAFLPKAAAAAGTIRFAGDFTAAPAVYYDDKHVIRGSDYEICNAIAAHLGVKAEWTNVPFGGLIPALGADRVDATCSAMYVTPERSRVVAFVPYRMSGHGAAVLKGNPHKVRDLRDICGLAAVEVLGTVYEKTIKKQSEACVAAGKKPIDLKTFATAADVAEQLADGRADVWLAGDTILDYYMRKRPGVLEKAFSRKDLTLVGIGVDPRNVALGKAFSRALAAMKADGSYRGILAKYGIPQEEIRVFNLHPAVPQR